MHFNALIKEKKDSSLTQNLHPINLFTGRIMRKWTEIKSPTGTATGQWDLKPAVCLSPVMVNYVKSSSLIEMHQYKVMNESFGATLMVKPFKFSEEKKFHFHG